MFKCLCGILKQNDVMLVCLILICLIMYCDEGHGIVLVAGVMVYSVNITILVFIKSNWV